MLTTTRVALLLALLPGPALAGGFEVPDRGARALGRGGATAVGATDLTALHYNPAVLAKLGGTRVLWHHSLIFHETSFSREPLSDAWGKDAGTTFPAVEDAESLFPLGAFVAASSHLGLPDWTFAAGVYGPSAIGRHDFPDYGPQSFLLTELDVLLLYYSLAAAWRHGDDFGFGVTLQWADSPKMVYELVVNSSASTKPEGFRPVAEDSGTLLKTRMELSDRFAPTAIAGAWWRPLPWLELGAAGRVVPVSFEMTGGVSTDKPTLITDDLTASFSYELPQTARGGARLIWLDGGRERADLELNVFWEGWSIIDAYRMEMDGEISGQEVQDLEVGKAWQDSVSVRLGTGIQVVPDLLELDLGGYLERGAVPDNYSHLDFPSFDRAGLGAGVVVSLGAFRVAAAYLHVFQEQRRVTEAFGKQFQQRPLRPCPVDCGGLSGVVANAGTIDSSYDLISLGVEADLSAL